MRTILLATTCLIAIASSAQAETKIDTKILQAIRTSTAKAGAPDDLLIATTGSVVTNGLNAVIVDSNNKLTNQGTIQITNVSNAAGVDVHAGTSGSITNSGSIVVDETYAPTDADNDGDLDGPFAVGSQRVGIRTQGAFAGNIANTGIISVEGNDSAGILLGGALAGNLAHEGTTSVIGDRALGIGLMNVTGNVRLAGTVTASGSGAVGARFGGEIGGAVVVQGAVVASGYRYTNPPADVTKLDADDLLQGGPAISIEGSVAKGIVLAVAPKDLNSSDPDEDKDGIEDAKEGSASVVSYGSAAALRIGASTRDIAIGSVEGTGTGFGLIIDGNVKGDALYKGVEANGLAIGGLGGQVNIAKGIGVSGTVHAVSVDKAAVAVRIGAGATTPELRNSGAIAALSGAGATSTATAIVIEAGGKLQTLRNSGQVLANVSGPEGTASAIVDRSGTLGLIENSGSITAKGAAAGSDRNVAIDLSANTAGASVYQTAVAAGIQAPSITGDVRFGVGNDVLDIADGAVRGGVRFGQGNNQLALSGDADMQGSVVFGAGDDKVSLGGTASLTGPIDFGGGADALAIGGNASFTGGLSNAAGLAVSVSGGTFGVIKSASIASLSVDNKGALKVVLDKTAGASSALTVAGTAQFSADAKLLLTINNVAQAEGDYVVVKAGSLVGADKLTATTDLLPFLYSGKLTVTGNEIGVKVARKSTTELGLNASETAAFSAIYTALGKDAKVGAAFVNIRDQPTFVGTLRQMLPDHAGGAFEAVTLGDRTIARAVLDPKGSDTRDGPPGFWLNQVAWGSTKSVGSTAGFKVGGWGVSGGGDISTPVGRVGASVAYLSGKDDDQATINSVYANQYSVAAHWKLDVGDFRASARGSYAAINFDGRRTFASNAGPEPIERTIESQWKGSLVSGIATLAHESWAGNLFFRPGVTAEYYRLDEDAHSETGGGAGLDLTVASRRSDELAVNATATVGLEIGGYETDESFLRLEAEGGRRQILSGALATTTAHFTGGQDFNLVPEERESGWLGRIRGVGGNSGFSLAGELGAEQRERRVAISARASLKIGL